MIPLPYVIGLPFFTWPMGQSGLKKLCQLHIDDTERKIRVSTPTHLSGPPSLRTTMSQLHKSIIGVDTDGYLLLLE